MLLLLTNSCRIHKLVWHVLEVNLVPHFQKKPRAALKHKPRAALDKHQPRAAIKKAHAAIQKENYVSQLFSRDAVKQKHRAAV